MHPRHIAIALGLVCTGAAAGQQEFPVTPTGTIHRQFIAEFNSGDTLRIQQFVDEHYARPTRGIGNYWNAVFREAGPLELQGVTTERRGDRTREIFWYRGVRTRAWLGINLRHENDAPFRLVGNSVTRGIRPALFRGAGAVSDQALADSLEHVLTGSAEHGHFSGTVLVARGEQVLYEGAFGYANRDAGIRNVAGTAFNLASVTKMFTGVAIAQLVERGHVRLEDPVSRFVPEYPAHIGNQVTVRHLLTHSSGIEIDDDREFNRTVAAAESMDDLLNAQLEYLPRLNLGNYEDFEPLGTFDYTNEGIDLLGVIIERVSGMSWDAYLAEHVFEPAGMTGTAAHVLTPYPAVATAYTSNGRLGGRLAGPRRAITNREDVGAYRPAGSGTSTARDMWRFLTAVRNATLLGPDMSREIVSPQIDVPVPPGMGIRRWYGFAFDITEVAGVTRIGHTGGAPGMSTVVEFYPDLDVTVIVLSNFDRASGPVNMYIQELIGAAN